MMFIQAFDFESERRGEIFFVAQHDIDQRGQFTINFARAFRSANSLP